MSDALFPTGRLVATPGAIEALERANQDAMPFLCRHVSGDWGEVNDDEEDKELNDAAVKNGGRLLSAYLLNDSTKIWIITEAADESGNREVTTILLPDEY